MRHLANIVGALAVALAVQACVVHDTPVNMGYGYGYASGTASVGQPNPYEVSSMPPEPLYEQMTPSPGEGFVWIDGYWHWNGYEWVWVSGRWEQQQDGYVYVQPYYDDASFVYTPGYWSRPEQAPQGWRLRERADGRPAMVSPPSGYRPPTGTGPRPPGGRPPTRPGGVERPPTRGIAPEAPIYERPPRVPPHPSAQWQPAPTAPIGNEPVVRPPQPPSPAQPYEPAPIYSRPGGPPPRPAAPAPMPAPTPPPPIVPRPTAPPPAQHPTAPAPHPTAPAPAQPAHPVHSHQ